MTGEADKPLAKVVPLDAPQPKQMSRLGFMDGQHSVPDDFDQISAAEIVKLFYDE